MKKIILLALFSISLVTPALADDAPVIQTAAKQAIVVDYDTGTVLFAKNADERMPTSSMSKIMSMYVIFDAIKKGQMSLDQELPISEKAWKMQGSKMFVMVGSKVKVEDLIKGVVIQSGNDAAVALAEGLAGSEDAFAAMLNKKAKELGMNNSHFMDASGWPDPNHYSTARDLATLARALIHDFPDRYPLFSQIDFTYNKIKQGNRNPLLYRNMGVDGIKTGHTDSGGYGLMASGVYQGRRVIAVLNGMDSEQARADEGATLMDWGMKNFTDRKLFKAGDTVENARVVLGRTPSIPLIVKEDVALTLPKAASDDFKVTVKYKEPLTAPIAKDQELGTVTIEVPHAEPMVKILYAGADAPKLGFFSAAIAKARIMLSRG